MGASPQEIQRVFAMGPRNAVESLLHGTEDFDLFPAPEMVSDTSHLAELRGEVAKNRADPEAARMARRVVQKEEARLLRDLRGWWIRRIRFSSYPLRETMVLFWHGHFASSIVKVRSTHDMWRQNELFRSHALGDFRSLARAIPKDPAMMRYLDISGSAKSLPNENFARELMELFLLGEGNYSEEDIREAARAFTGFRIHPISREVIFNKSRYDDGAKVLFGGREVRTPEEVVDALLARPECAPFLAGKIWAFFAGQEPTPKIRYTLGETLRGSGFDLSVLLRALLLSHEFYSPEIRFSQIKSPVQWLVSSSKALECGLNGDFQEQQVLRDLGQDLFVPPNVKGWEGGRSWITASTILARGNSAADLFLNSSRRHPDLARLVSDSERRSAGPLCDTLARRILQKPLVSSERTRMISTVEAQGLPASDTTISELIQQLMATPEYQLS